MKSAESQRTGEYKRQAAASALSSNTKLSVDVDKVSAQYAARQHGPLPITWETCRLLSPIPRVTKRAMDLMVVIAGGVLIAPLMLVIAAVIKISSPGPVFYSQERVGRGGRPFRVWKFRSMVTDAEDVLNDYLQSHPEVHEEWERERKLKDDPRILPRIGPFLRKSSLDELPQLWNVLKGEMSLVGPRPLPQYHLDGFDDEFCRFRHKITPGITGLWQVASRNCGSPEMFIKHDIHYIRNWSLWLDLQILVRTPIVVLSGTGA